MIPNFEQIEPYPDFTDQHQGIYPSFANHLFAPTDPVPQQAYPSGWDQEMWQHNNSHTGYGHGNFQQGGFDSRPDHRGRPFFQTIPQDVLPYDGAPHGQEEWVTEDTPGYFDEQINGGPEYHNMPASQHYQPQATFDGAVRYLCFSWHLCC
jgi:hypothetical protein